MAKYWVYLNDQVNGPYELDELIRLPGFSRRTMVSIDDHSGAAGRWIGPAEIPELARIFQKVDELHEAPAGPAARPAPKPKRRIPAHLTPVPPPAEDSSRLSAAWPWLLIACAFLGGGYHFWSQASQREQRVGERQTAQAMIENAALPSSSLYATLRQYLQEKQISSRWEFERTPAELYNVTVSWPPPERSSALPLYAFEVNLQVESVRGLNTAAIKLLSEGFPAPAAGLERAEASRRAAPPRKSPGDVFPSAINNRREAYEQGDFESIWGMFSRRRKSEMSQGGINESSFIRMQRLTYRPGSGLRQTIVKTKAESDSERLALLRQSQPKHPDIYIKQRWVWEDNAWRLDDEEKKAASIPPPSQTEPGPESVSPAAVPTGAIPNLPGLSDNR
ncbi:MAG: hypothetical protein A2992_03235 [Elusimicrobia bacterium RIFCSPLOWO2_01_FULL_59_12]|nr:MAG: hypothetical protein A2992_03235 [Elusimicrobia bacterium RIFCSPLOWO2_01_FULL_59_12]